MRTNTDNDIRVAFGLGTVLQVEWHSSWLNMQLVNLKQHRLITGGFGPFVCAADKCLICPQYVVCCFWPDLLLRRMSKIEGTLECGVDTLPLITSGCHMLTSIKYRGKE